MKDARQDPSSPFHSWSPFGLAPVLIWPAWASKHLPEHFRERRQNDIRVASASRDLDTGNIVDLQEYRRRIAKPALRRRSATTADEGEA